MSLKRGTVALCHAMLSMIYHEYRERKQLASHNVRVHSNVKADSSALLSSSSDSSSRYICGVGSVLFCAGVAIDYVYSCRRR